MTIRGFFGKLSPSPRLYCTRECGESPTPYGWGFDFPNDHLQSRKLVLSEAAEGEEAQAGGDQVWRGRLGCSGHRSVERDGIVGISSICFRQSDAILTGSKVCYGKVAGEPVGATEGLARGAVATGY